MKGINSLSTGLVFTLALIVAGLGFFGILSVVFKKSSDYLLDNVYITVFFEPDLAESESLAIHNEISNMDLAASVHYTSSNEALLEYRDQLGEDIVALLGENPLPASSAIRVRPDYLQGSKISQEITKLKAMEDILDVQYVDSFSTLYFNELGNSKIVFLSLLGVLILVAIYLLASVIKLALLQDRKTVSTQFLIGAKRGFILRPYLRKAVVWSLLSFTLGLVIMGLGLLVLIFGLEHFSILSIQKSTAFIYENWRPYTILAVLLLLGTTGVIYLSTYIVVSWNIRKLTYNFH